MCSPLLVVSNSRGKNKLVLDLRGVSQYLPKQRFKYEGLNLVSDMCSHDEYFFTFDLKSSYHHVDIHPDSIPYLGFSWGALMEEGFYVSGFAFWSVHSLLRFTKLLCPLVQHWRVSGLRVILLYR